MCVYSSAYKNECFASAWEKTPRLVKKLLLLFFPREGP